MFPGTVLKIISDQTMNLQIEQATVDIVLEEDEEYLFELVGKKCVFRPALQVTCLTLI